MSKSVLPAKLVVGITVFVVVIVLLSGSAVWATGEQSPLAQTVPPPEPPTPGSWYRVEAGDTLSSIAMMSGVSCWRIAQANGIWDPNLIYVGQLLYVPSPFEPFPYPRPGRWTPTYPIWGYGGNYVSWSSSGSVGWGTFLGLSGSLWR